MALQPRRTKYRKQQRGRMPGVAAAGHFVAFGEVGLQSLGRSWITSQQIEAARRTITHHLRRRGKVWVRIFPDKPVTAKPLETRQGGGKANVDHWVAVVRPGRVMFEVAGVREDTAREALRLASHKLPVPTRVMVRQHEGV